MNHLYKINISYFTFLEKKEKYLKLLSANILIWPVTSQWTNSADNKLVIFSYFSQNGMSLPKQAYSNILKFLPSKNENFQRRMLIFFLISAQNIHCGYSLEPPWQGGSNKYPQSMLMSRNKKNNVYPCKPLFYYIKVGFKRVNIIGVFFRCMLCINT